jgi:hypothetical protein
VELATIHLQLVDILMTPADDIPPVSIRRHPGRRVIGGAGSRHLGVWGVIRPRPRESHRAERQVDELVVDYRTIYH